MNNITRKAAPTFEQVRALLEKQHAAGDIFDVALGVAASSGPTRELTLVLDELAAVLAARLNYATYSNVKTYSNVMDGTLAVFEPAAYDWITYEKRDKEDAE